MTKKKATSKSVGEALYTELRLKLLQFFSSPKINYHVNRYEPFVVDINAGRYTNIQLKEMVRALYRAGLLQAGPASKPPVSIVYGLTKLGRMALNELLDG